MSIEIYSHNLLTHLAVINCIAVLLLGSIYVLLNNMINNFSDKILDKFSSGGFTYSEVIIIAIVVTVVGWIGSGILWLSFGLL